MQNIFIYLLFKYVLNLKLQTTILQTIIAIFHAFHATINNLNAVHKMRLYMNDEI